MCRGSAPRRPAPSERPAQRPVPAAPARPGSEPGSAAPQDIPPSDVDLTAPAIRALPFGITNSHRIR